MFLKIVGYRNINWKSGSYQLKMKIIIIIITTSRTGPSGKNNVVSKLLSQPHKLLRHGKLKKTELREATNGCLHP